MQQSLSIDMNADTEKKGRWRMNTSLLKDESFSLSLKDDLVSFFEVNAGSASTRAMEWEASKAYIRGKMIAHSSKKKKEDMRRIKEFESEIKNQEIELSKKFSDKLYQDTCKLNYKTFIIKKWNMHYLDWGQISTKGERRQASCLLDN